METEEYVRNLKRELQEAIEAAKDTDTDLVSPKTQIKTTPYDQKDIFEAFKTISAVKIEPQSKKLKGLEILKSEETLVNKNNDTFNDTSVKASASTTYDSVTIVHSSPTVKLTDCVESKHEIFEEKLVKKEVDRTFSVSSIIDQAAALTNQDPVKVIHSLPISKPRDSVLNSKHKITESDLPIEVIDLEDEISVKVEPSLEPPVGLKMESNSKLDSRNETGAEMCVSSDATNSLAVPKDEASASSILSIKEITIIDLETDDVISVCKIMEESVASVITISDEDSECCIPDQVSSPCPVSVQSPVDNCTDIVDLRSPQKNCSFFQLEPETQLDCNLACSKSMMVPENSELISNDQEVTKNLQMDIDNVGLTIDVYTSVQPITDFLETKTDSVSKSHDDHKPITSDFVSINSNNITTQINGVKSETPSATNCISASEEKITDSTKNNNFKNIKMLKYDFTVELVRYNLEKGELSSKDEKDLLDLDMFSVLEEEVDAFFHIAKELNNLGIGDEDLKFEKYPLTRKQSLLKNISLEIKSLTEIPEDTNLQFHKRKVAPNLSKTEFAISALQIGSLNKSSNVILEFETKEDITNNISDGNMHARSNFIQTNSGLDSYTELSKTDFVSLNCTEQPVRRNESQKLCLQSKQAFNEIRINVNSSVLPPVLQENTNNEMNSFGHPEVKLCNSEPLQKMTHLMKDECVQFVKPAAELINMSNEQLRNILVQTKHYNSSRLALSADDGNNATPIVIQGNIRSLRCKIRKENLPTSENIAALAPTLESMVASVSTVENYAVEEIGPQYDKSTEPPFIHAASAEEVESNNGSEVGHKVTDEYDSEATLPYSEEMAFSDDSDTKVSKEKFQNDIQISDESIEKVSTIPISEGQLFDTSSRKHILCEKSIPENMSYASKLETIMKRNASMLKERQMKLKKTKIISDPKLAEFCEKQRQKGKIVIPVINPLPLVLEPKKKSKKEPKKKLETQSLKKLETQSLKKLETQSLKKLETQPLKKLETQSLKETGTTKGEEMVRRNSCVVESEKLDDTSELFAPDCVVSQTSKKSSKKRRYVGQDEPTSASVVQYGSRTSNRGEFLTEDSIRRRLPKARRTASSFFHEADVSNAPIETMHCMTETPEINDLPLKDLGPTTRKLTILELQKLVEQTKKNCQPSKIPLEIYTQRQKILSSVSVRDPRLASNRNFTKQQYCNTNSDLWSPGSSNSLSSVEQQANMQSSLPETHLLPPIVQLNQETAMPNYQMCNALPSHTTYGYSVPYVCYYSGPEQPGHYLQSLPPVMTTSNVPQNYMQRQFFIPSTSMVPNSFVPPVQSHRTLTPFDTEAAFHTPSPPVPQIPQSTTGSKRKQLVKLVPDSWKAFIGRKVIDNNIFLLLVLQNNADWLYEQPQRQSPPTIVDSTALRKVVDSYPTPDDHYNTYLPLLLDELWQRIFHTWTHMTNFNFFCKMMSYQPMDVYSHFELKTVAKSSDIDSRDFPEKGTLVIMSFGSDTDGWSHMLGYVNNVNITYFKNWKSDPKHETLLLALSITCAYSVMDINMKDEVKMQTLCNVTPHLKQNEALFGLKTSRLLKLVLEPKGDSVIRADLSNRYSDSEMSIIDDIMDEVVLPLVMPRLILVKTSSYTDRAATLVGFVEALKKKHKIMLCSRTRDSLQDVCYHLVRTVDVNPHQNPGDKPNDVVILGSRSSVNKDLKKYILDERAKQQSSNADKEVLQRIRSDILKKCDVILTLIKNCHDDEVASSVAADLDRSLVCIVNEANLCTEPEALIPTLFAVSKLILIGNPNERAKVCSKTAIDNCFHRSFFERAYFLSQK